MTIIQDLKNVWMDYRNICIIAAAVVGVLLLLFLIMSVRAHKKAKAYKRQVITNKALQAELETVKASLLEYSSPTANEEKNYEEDLILEEENVENEVVGSEQESDTDEESSLSIDDAKEVDQDVQENYDFVQSDDVDKEVMIPAENEEVSTPVDEEVPAENEEVLTPVDEEVPAENEEVLTPVDEEVPAENEEVSTPVDEKILAENEEVSTSVDEDTPLEKEDKDDNMKESKAKSQTKKVTSSKTTTSRAKGKYEIVPDATGFKYYLKASNGEILIVSESYTTLSGCKNAIKRLQENTVNATINIEEDKNHNCQFHVVKGTRVVAHSANYNTKASAQNAAKSFMKYVNTDVIKVQEESKNDLELVSLDDAQVSSDVVGKIVVYKEKDIYLYKLIANNGQTICMSATYKTMVTIQKSISNFKEAVYEGKFYIQKDKNGLYQFKLYNKSSRLIMTGESFQSADSCRSNILSCYRFAKNASIEYSEDAI